MSKASKLNAKLEEIYGEDLPENGMQCVHCNRHNKELIFGWCMHCLKRMEEIKRNPFLVFLSSDEKEALTAFGCDLDDVRYDSMGYKIAYSSKCGNILKVHRMVYIHFYGDIEEGLVIHHKDFNRLNNKRDNLVKLTVSEHGTMHTNEAGYDRKKDKPNIMYKNDTFLDYRWANREP